jgi:hypothetical protein
MACARCPLWEEKLTFSTMGLAAIVVALHLSIEMDVVGLSAQVSCPISTRMTTSAPFLLKGKGKTM